MLYISIVKNMTFAIQSKTYQMDKPRFFKAETIKEKFFFYAVGSLCLASCLRIKAVQVRGSSLKRSLSI